MDKKELYLYDELLKVVEPYLGDFTGVNEKGEFDIVLAVKELIEERDEYIKDLEGYRRELQEEIDSVARRLGLEPVEDFANFDCIDAVVSFNEEELEKYKGICKRAGLAD